MSKERIDKLQVPYSTFNDDGNNAQGTGLGLFICKEIVKNLGPMTKIHIESIVEKGSSF